MSELMCRNERRREKVRRQVQLNGLDYLEVGDPKDIERSLGKSTSVAGLFPR